ncbi:protein kinase, putative [Trypanosoma brucei brucei TREU927]|uniref:mitogen-activated protein kinase kinase n=1 Tax=Trypanosoma brucei brucei (strain 927/4 GUTat10.1) TaxID=185431 RepID=Q382B0_TRYB2|nr:protein kinase, putative [Trypanosoma brucei brucei TREU927]EAN80371.1 protein kinase, putative [Trypanosoma brucei brucei TREU927]
MVSLRIRKTRPPPLGFSLALPPPSVVGEVRVQQGNELFINVDDTNISPIITMDGSLPTGQFVHVTNTNLFVLVDGASLFTEAKTTQREEPQSNHIGDLVDNSASAEKGRSPQRSPCSNLGASVDSVEAAIRGIEDDSGEVRRDLSSSFSLLPKTEGDSPVLSRCSSRCRMSCQGTKGVKYHGGASLPHQYTALFTKGAGAVSGLAAATAGANRVGNREVRCNVLRGKIRGFLPWYVVEQNWTTSPKCSNASTSGTLGAATGTSAVASQSSASSVLVDTAVGDKVDKHAKRKNTLLARGRGNNSRSASLYEVGRTNRSLDLKEVEVLGFVGKGTQGAVYRVLLDNKLYGLKCIDVRELTEASSLVEHQSRKGGLVKELNMIRLQRSKSPPQYLLRLFDASVTRDREKLHLHILMELMSFSVEDAQRMVSRIPSDEMVKLTESAFRKHMAGSHSVKLKPDTFLQRNSESCVHLTGRRSYKTPEDWEMNIDRQTPVPEIILSMLAADVLGGLKELHEDYAIVHCDIKPANILIDYDMERFRLADFGCGCQMDPQSRKTRPVTFDLGSKLYKAPERLSNELYNAGVEGGLSEVEFSFDADVWSLGVTLLELRNGVHPCHPFKSDYWNYRNNLKLSRMVKPVSWSYSFYDFIVRCLMRKPEQRWSVSRLLQHPFIVKYSELPRAKLRVWMEKLRSESETFQRRQQRELLEEHILLSTGRKGPDMYRHRSRSSWESFTKFLKVAPHYQDDEKFPHLC